MAVSKDVHAIHGSWSCELADDGSVLCYVGKFHQEDKHHAQGTARFFEHAKITKGYHKPLEDADNRWVVRVWRYDNIHAFERWPRFADLLPDIARALDQDMQMLEIERWRQTIKKQSAPRFRPLAEKYAEAIVKRLPWEMVDVGHQRSYVVEVAEPVLALQMAVYLARHGFISDDERRRIESEVSYALKENNSAVDWSRRIGIDASKAESFGEQFVSGAPMPMLSHEEIRSIMHQSIGKSGWSLSA